MRIVVTGASGFLGKQLVPQLNNSGVELLLVGRDSTALQLQYPGYHTASYEEIAQKANGFDAILHLAVRNNDQTGTLEDFRAANVVLPEMVATAAVSAGIATFINVTSLQARLEESASLYALTKAEGEALLARLHGLQVVTLRLPAVYGLEYRGKLGVLNKLPSVVRSPAFYILASFKPTVHIDRVLKAVMDAVGFKLTGTRIVSDAQTENAVFLWSKKFIDIGFAIFVIVFLWWLLLGVVIAIRLTSSGPAIFKQTRVGRHRVNFTCYKLRTMYVGTQQAGTHEVSANAITKVGAFLRKTKLDEFPQVWNILKNELSLVGPRPGLPNQVELTEERAARGVYEVMPGITGWAQVQNIDMSEPKRLAEAEAEYIALRSLPLEFKILIQTAIGRGQGDKVKDQPR